MCGFNQLSNGTALKVKKMVFKQFLAYFTLDKKPKNNY